MEISISLQKQSCALQVCYKKTDFLGDQVLLSGFAPGGLTEVPPATFKTCSMGNTLAQELGPFGFKPEVSSSPLTRFKARTPVHLLPNGLPISSTLAAFVCCLFMVPVLDSIVPEAVQVVNGSVGDQPGQLLSGIKASFPHLLLLR